MKLIAESNHMANYLAELGEVDYSHHEIQLLLKRLYKPIMNETEMAEAAFRFVRDEISHTWDIQSERITKTASEVLRFKEGICYAKSNLLAALLRAVQIPTGFCYQKLTLGDTPDTGYCIHALNAVYLRSYGRWFRLDARGNKEGIQAEFSLDEEKLAFPIRPQYGEIDYPVIFATPSAKTMGVLERHTNALYMYEQGLPVEL
ncbi:transglutaminase-like domain-containing protein [Paenibacillus harenae]|uniref:Transglutaminase-like putative cysteine protease n=1 Tax=Paenibacillus harenae TaxID=306543 RepID=A0ABT9U9F7_PAEHA|nr:transglutaminase family protein [Paenibacillus harenae]MDQ0116270.1 transglutaminase-like putative cysteine protease [Paenibacillus harenae]